LPGEKPKSPKPKKIPKLKEISEGLETRAYQLTKEDIKKEKIFKINRG